MRSIRKAIFRTHLVCGLAAGVIIFIMSFTGVVIAFEHEILDWWDRDLARVEVPSGGSAKPIGELRQAVAGRFPAFKTTSITVPRHPASAYIFRAGRDGELYVNPYTGEANAPRTKTAHDFFHLMAAWHRWLGAKDGPASTARLVTGVCNAVFAGLCITGIYLWFPRFWSTRALRPRVWFVGGLRGKARDYNWHNAIGLWTAPVLLALVLTGVVISFGWAHDLVFRLTGEQPPKFRDFRMMAVPPPQLPPVADGATPLELDEVLAKVVSRFREWDAVVINLTPDAEGEKPVDMAVMVPALFPTAGRVQVYAHPCSGEILKQVAFSDRSAGVRARVWVRFLHTGEAGGLTGRIVAVVATLGSLVLVWTGFALSWRRFRSRW